MPKGYTLTSGTLWWLPRILDCDQLDPTETLLLIALVDHVGADDACFVGIEKLAGRARISYGTARRRLANLEQRGFLIRSRRRRGDGNMSVYDYELQRPAFGEPARNLRDDQRASGDAMTSAPPDARAEVPRRDEPPRTDEENTPAAAPLSLILDADVPDLFDAFWKAYPSKRGKGHARKAWASALKRARAADVVAGAIRYGADPNLPEPQWMPRPATWLNGDCWEDPPLAQRASNTARPNRTNVHRVVDDPEARARPSERLHL